MFFKLLKQNLHKLIYFSKYHLYFFWQTTTFFIIIKLSQQKSNERKKNISQERNRTTHSKEIQFSISNLELNGIFI
jgi:hypothetical protein